MYFFFRNSSSVGTHGWSSMEAKGGSGMQLYINGFLVSFLACIFSVFVNCNWSHFLSIIHQLFPPKKEIDETELGLRFCAKR